MRKIYVAMLVWLVSTSVARADPISAIIVAVSAGISSLGTAIAATGLVSFASLGAFLASPIGGLILGIGLQLIVGTLFKQKRQTPTIEAGKINVRINEPERWMNAGLNRQGGGVLFGEYDAVGYFWYLVVHSDSQLVDFDRYYLDDLSVEVDGNGFVTTGEFCLDNKENIWVEGKPKVSYFQLWTTTYTDGNPTPPPIAAFKTAFPGPNGWTDDHKLVGTTYTVVKCYWVPIENRHKVYKWKGPIGLGEPSVSIVGTWSKPYDPRTNTYGPTRNSALIWAWFRTQKYGRGKAFDSINWTRIAEQANICDQIVLDKNGNPHARYRCGSSVPESKERNEAEQEILISCDGQIVFDDDGKSWVRVGYYYEPTLALSRNRDIYAVESVEAQDGESETQGVIVRYIDPGARWTAQPSAPWKNPLYYVEGQTPRYLTIDALTIQDHNQAIRLAKSIGMRSQSLYKLLPTVGLRGIKARQERIVSFDYDNEFAGPHEIVTPVEVDENGVFCGFGVVPVDANRWTLLAGEEPNKPVFAESTSDNIPEYPTNVVITFDGAIRASFDPLPRSDWRVEFQYKPDADPDTSYTGMYVNTQANTAASGGLPQNQLFNVQYRTVTSAGRATDWLTPPVDIFTSILTISGTPVTSGKVGVVYAGFDVDASGGTTPYLFVDLYGRLPPGLSINTSTGVVSGTPTTAGTYANVLIRAQDINGAFAVLPAFTITVIP